MIDEIFEIDEDFEEIEKCIGNTKFDYPVASLLKESIFFNAKARSLVPERIKWIVTTNYIVGMPADETDTNAYKAHIYDLSIAAAFQKAMRQDKKIRSGYYKVYKYKNGFCMKRNERIAEYEIS